MSVTCHNTPNRSSRLNTTLYSLPVHCLNDYDIQLENTKGINFHFHAPENQHNRFMASMTAFQKRTLRDVQRPAMYCSNSGKSTAGLRPATAPVAGSAVHRAKHTQQGALCGAGSKRPALTSCSNMQPQQDGAARATQHAAMCTKTRQGVPCLSIAAVMDADIVEGRPASAAETNHWRVARVKAYHLPASRYGYGESGRRAFHQSYGFYKYHGFAGMGAKTSWASSPTKHKQVMVDAAQPGY